MTEVRPPATVSTVKASPFEAPSEDRPATVSLVANATFVPNDEGRYERVRVIGQGGMGTIVLVRDRAVGRSVAWKQLNFDVREGEDLARFAREARVQGQLEHPSIVPVYDVGCGPDGRPYFTMKRVRGTVLSSILSAMADGKPTPYSRRQLLSAFSQLCAAAHYAHECGVVHRDIKPGNVMLGSYGEVYLLDWGVAKVIGELEPDRARRTSQPGIDAKSDVDTEHGMIMGTLTTMAPEQALGGEVDARTDVYALGAVLFELLTLERFHPEGDFDEVIAAIVRGVDARPSVRAPKADVPPELEALCVAATRPDMVDRIPSARALRDAIESYLDGDRDLELRRVASKKLALEARDAADMALDTTRTEGDEEAARASALGTIGRALALDPSNQDALATLVRLLTTPPRTTPEEVRREDEAALRKNIRRAGIAGSCIYGYISLNALSTWSLGVHDVRTFTIAHILWAFAFIASLATALRPSYVPLLTTFFIGVATSTYTTAVYGPYLLVPSFITVHAVLFSLVRDWRPRIAVIATSCVAWTLSVFGDRLGLFPSVVHYTSGDILIHSPVIDFPEGRMTFYLYASLLAAVIGPALVSGAIRSAYHKSELAMRLQSWQLRRLVSDASEATHPRRP